MEEWNSSGLDTELKRYDVLLSYPTRPSKLLLVNQTASRLNTIHSWQILDGLAYNTSPFSFYSSSGVSSGKLLYVNYGRDNDFRYLKKENISCEGKILILRYGKIHEREKVFRFVCFFAVPRNSIHLKISFFFQFLLILFI